MAGDGCYWTPFRRLMQQSGLRKWYKRVGGSWQQQRYQMCRKMCSKCYAPRPKRTQSRRSRLD
eukprot:2128441-Rhodomonas_salina.1